jgi:hypothetical protein
VRWSQNGDFRQVGYPQLCSSRQVVCMPEPRVCTFSTVLGGGRLCSASTTVITRPSRCAAPSRRALQGVAAGIAEQQPEGESNMIVQIQPCCTHSIAGTLHCPATQKLVASASCQPNTLICSGSTHLRLGILSSASASRPLNASSSGSDAGCVTAGMPRSIDSSQQTGHHCRTVPQPACLAC